MFSNHSGVLVTLGLIIGLGLSMVLLRAALPTTYETVSQVSIDGKCYKASGAVPRQYDSLKEYLKKDPVSSQENVQLTPTNCL